MGLQGQTGGQDDDGRVVVGGTWGSAGDQVLRHSEDLMNIHGQIVLDWTPPEMNHVHLCEKNSFLFDLRFFNLHQLTLY